MMESTKFRKVLAFTLAFLVFGTSMSYSIDLHYCSGQLKNISLFGEAETCHDEDAICPMHGKAMQEQKKSCCENEKFIVQDLDEDYTSNLYQTEDLNDYQPTPYLFFNIQNIAPVSIKPIIQKEYRPPIPDLDIPVLIQSFLL